MLTKAAKLATAKLATPPMADRACRDCNGTGNGWLACVFCKGTGTNGGFRCSLCGGRGFGKCGSCSGTGRRRLCGRFRLDETNSRFCRDRRQISLASRGAKRDAALASPRPTAGRVSAQAAEPDAAGDGRGRAAFLTL